MSQGILYKRLIDLTDKLSVEHLSELERTKYG
jgi:hypothetical protein